MSVRVGFGISDFPFSSPAALWKWVDLLEESGADSLWQTDRLASPRPFLESMSMMAALAGRTERIKFGMNAIVIPFRDPLVLAKECATIDYLSGGRLLPAFGVGAEIAPEWRATGREPRGRGAQANEALELMNRLWTEESVTYQGKHYQYVEASVEPKPVQKPLPIWIGGSSKAAIRRTARYGTGWLGGLQTPQQVEPVIRAIKKETAAVGRSIDDDHYGAGFTYRFGSWDDPAVERAASALKRRAPDVEPDQYFAVGDAAEIIRRFEAYIAVGAHKFVARPLAEGDDEIFSQTQRLLEEVLPLVERDS